MSDYAEFLDMPKLTPFLVLGSASCRNCHRIIYEVAHHEGWWHEAEDQSGVRGCRAASYEAGVWDDSLDKRWKAEPDVTD